MNIRTRRAQQTKQKILETAIEMFNEKGFNNVTVDEIVEKTETSKGAFYTHFRSKHDIFLEKFKEIDQYYIEEVYPSLDSYPTPTEKLTHFFTMQMSYIENDLGWDVVRTIYEQELNTDRKSFFLNKDRPLYKYLRELCLEGQRLNEFRTDLNVEQLMKVIMRNMRGILYDWSIHQGEFSLIEEQKDLVKVIVSGIRSNDS